ncbi:MAG: DUF4345 family protein [Myxococcota bacterium]|nr:DUF4345 family protein [Myxococcota bacterium]
MATKVFLGLNALLFIGYGLACLASPSLVAESTGMVLTSGVASTEVRAMYGGLQTAIGLLALLGILRPGTQAAVLLALGFLFVGLASGRMLGILIDPEPGIYNIGAVAFEALFGVFAVMLLSRTAAARGTQATG